MRKSFSKELSLHPKQIMNNSQIDTACFIELTCLTWVWHLAQLFFICHTSFSLSFVLLWIRLNNNKGDLEWRAYEVWLTWTVIKLSFKGWLNSSAPGHLNWFICLQRTETKPILGDWFDCWIYKSSAVWIEKHPAPLASACEWALGIWMESALALPHRAGSNPAGVAEWGWKKSSQERLKARQGRVNWSDPQRGARPHFPAEKKKKTQPKKRLCQQEVPPRCLEWQTN